MAHWAAPYTAGLLGQRNSAAPHVVDGVAAPPLSFLCDGLVLDERCASVTTVRRTTPATSGETFSSAPRNPPGNTDRSTVFEHAVANGRYRASSMSPAAPPWGGVHRNPLLQRQALVIWVALTVISRRSSVSVAASWRLVGGSGRVDAVSTPPEVATSAG